MYGGCLLCPLYPLLVLRQQDWVGMKFLTCTGSPVRNEKIYLIDYVENFVLKDYHSQPLLLTCILVADWSFVHICSHIL